MKKTLTSVALALTAFALIAAPRPIVKTVNVQTNGVWTHAIASEGPLELVGIQSTATNGNLTAKLVIADGAEQTLGTLTNVTANRFITSIPANTYVFPGQKVVLSGASATKHTVFLILKKD